MQHDRIEEAYQVQSNAEDQLRDILEMEEVAAHTLVNKSKRAVSIGKMRLFINKDKIWITINHWNSQELMDNTTFYRLQYDKNISYIFQNIVAGFISLTIPNTQDSITKLEGGLKQIGKIRDYEEGLENQKFNRKIQYHCPEIKQIPIHSENFFTRFFILGGKMQHFFGSRAHQLHHTHSNNPDIQERLNAFIANKFRNMKNRLRWKNKKVETQIEK